MTRKTIAGLAALLVALSLAGCSTPEVIVRDAAPAPTETVVASEVAAPTAEPVEPAAPVITLTLSQQNAVDKAKSYLAIMGFSRSGLIDQLVFEGFAVEDSTFAVDHITPDWNAEAAEKAQSYLDIMAMSAEGLADQLRFEGFDEAQIQHALAAVGY
jgi:hypothetical protein